jgi:predicted RND superfamily exporter protein
VGPEELRRAGLGELVEAMVLPTDAGYRILSLVPDTPEIVALFEAAREELPGVRLVSQQRFGQELSRAIRRDFVRFVSLASLLVTLLLTTLFRDLKKVLLALAPVATGLTVLFGVMGAIGLKFTLLNVMATILVIGLGVDYGIFMVCKMTEGYEHATGRAVLVSGLTTIAGFGALVLASHPALHSIGVTVLLGIGAAIPTALLVIPAFYREPA